MRNLKLLGLLLSTSILVQGCGKQSGDFKKISATIDKVSEAQTVETLDAQIAAALAEIKAFAGKLSKTVDDHTALALKNVKDGAPAPVTFDSKELNARLDAIIAEPQAFVEKFAKDDKKDLETHKKTSVAVLKVAANALKDIEAEIKKKLKEANSLY